MSDMSTPALPHIIEDMQAFEAIPNSSSLFVNMVVDQIGHTDTLLGWKENIQLKIQ